MAFRAAKRFPGGNCWRIPLRFHWEIDIGFSVRTIGRLAGLLSKGISISVVKCVSGGISGVRIEKMKLFLEKTVRKFLQNL